jgi:hypothetical protein
MKIETLTLNCKTDIDRILDDFFRSFRYSRTNKGFIMGDKLQYTAKRMYDLNKLIPEIEEEIQTNGECEVKLYTLDKNKNYIFNEASDGSLTLEQITVIV